MNDCDAGAELEIDLPNQVNYKSRKKERKKGRKEGRSVFIFIPHNRK
jgi:hypothetical protein